MKVTPTPIGDPHGFVKHQIQAALLWLRVDHPKKIAEEKILDRNRAEYILTVYQKGLSTEAKWILWTLRSARGKKIIGAGRLVQFTGSSMHEKYAAIEEKYQSKGLYSTIIIALRRILKTPIESDRSVSESAIGAWKKAGAVVAKRGGDPVYRVNPYDPGTYDPDGAYRGKACQAIAALIYSIRNNESSLATAVRVSPHGLDIRLKECGSSVLLFKLALVWRRFVWRNNFVDSLSELAIEKIAGNWSTRKYRFVEDTAGGAYLGQTDKQLILRGPSVWRELDEFEQGNVINLWKFARARRAKKHQAAAAKQAAMAMEHILSKNRFQFELLTGILPIPLTPRVILQKIRENE